VKQYSATE